MQYRSRVPATLGVQTRHPHDRNSYLRRWILTTMNCRFATEVGRFPPKHHVLLAGKPFPLHIDLEMSKAVSTTSSRGSARLKRRRIVVVVVPPIDELDLVGPIQAFSAANRLFGKTVYEVEIVTNARELKVQGEGGLLSFAAQGRFQDVKGKVDSLLLVCGLGTRTARDPALFAWLRKMAPAVRRLGAVCVGSFLLAEAGLLNGKRATTHWKFGRELASRYPRLKVEFDPIWVKDGNIYTSAGISAGIDLALGWVEEDCGSRISQEIAREFVLFLRRPSGQTQLSASLSAQASEMKAIHELQMWIAENLRNNLSVQMLAGRTAMSVRNFERVFTRELGKTPSQYVLQMRAEAARRQLESTDQGLKQIAATCGFGSAASMRRAFLRSVGTTPHRYRHRFDGPERCA
jgi:transcriptional regulator GlxA family with amidase domain